MGNEPDLAEPKKRSPEKPVTVLRKQVLVRLADLLDRLKDTGSDGVGVTLGVWTTILEIAFPIVFDEGVRNANGSATVCNAP